MSSRLSQARLALKKARLALRNNDRGQARLWAERAAQLAPQIEDPWLILAAVASPQASFKYLQSAFKVNPTSARALRGMDWASRRLQQDGPATAETQKASPVLKRADRANPPRAARSPGRRSRRSRSSRLLPLAVLVLGCLVLAVAAWLAMASPVVASMLPRQILFLEPLRAHSSAVGPVPNATYTPVSEAAITVPPAATATPGLAQPSKTSALELSTSTSSSLSTEQPTETTVEPLAASSAAVDQIPAAVPTSFGLFSREIVADTPTPEISPSESFPTSVVPSIAAAAKDGGHWIEVNLSQQMVNAYMGDAVVNSFLASTGTSTTPTVTGKYHIYAKLRYTDMTGPDYYLPNVPYTMYSYKDYGLHGTYWHHNFGTPMSHGCVNLSIPDAEWLYSFASVGTLIDVHY